MALETSINDHMKDKHFNPVMITRNGINYEFIKYAKLTILFRKSSKTMNVLYLQPSVKGIDWTQIALLSSNSLINLSVSF